MPDAATPLTSSKARAWLRPVLFGLASAALYGGWAFRANLANGVAAALRAALTQAGLSFAATAGVSVMVEAFFRLGRTPAQGFWLGAIGASIIANGTATAIHAIAGTPNILATVAPPAVIGTAFGFAYAWGLRAGTRRAR